MKNPKTRNMALDNIVYIGLENYFEFRELEKELNELKKPKTCP